MLPESAQRISSSVGSGVSCNSAMLVSIMPGVQKPHWSPCSSLNAAWGGCSVPPAARAATHRLHRGHLLTIGLDGEHSTGLYRRAVDQHGTGAAMSRIASNVGSGESEVLPEGVHQE